MSARVAPRSKTGAILTGSPGADTAARELTITSTVPVKDGKWQATQPLADWPPGEVIVRVIFQPSDQPDTIVKTYGSRGEFLSGLWVVEVDRTKRVEDVDTVWYVQPLKEKGARHGEASENLGYIPGAEGVGFGSTNQAAALLQLIIEKPDRARYSIVYTTDMDTVTLGCDLNLNVLVREHGTKMVEEPRRHGGVIF